MGRGSLRRGLCAALLAALAAAGCGGASREQPGKGALPARRDAAVALAPARECLAKLGYVIPRFSISAEIPHADALGAIVPLDDPLAYARVYRAARPGDASRLARAHDGQLIGRLILIAGSAPAARATRRTVGPCLRLVAAGSPAQLG